MLQANDFTQINNVWMLNQIVMFMDSIIICIGSISLLKYSSQAVPELESIILTIIEFFNGTFKKTMTMIILCYSLFGMMSYYILSYY